MKLRPLSHSEGLKVWQQPFTPLRAPTIANLRMDPFERAEHDSAVGFQRWYLERMFIIAPAGAFVGQRLQSFKEFPGARRLHFCRRAAGGTWRPLLRSPGPNPGCTAVRTST